MSLSNKQGKCRGRGKTGEGMELEVPLMSGIAHRGARMAPLICAALALLAPLQYRRPAANFIRAPPILLRPAIDGPTGQ